MSSIVSFDDSSRIFPTFSAMLMVLDYITPCLSSMYMTDADTKTEHSIKTFSY